VTLCGLQHVAQPDSLRRRFAPRSSQVGSELGVTVTRYRSFEVQLENFRRIRPPDDTFNFRSWCGTVTAF